MVVFFLVLIFIVGPVFLIACAILGSGGNSGFHFDNYSGNDDYSSNDGYSNSSSNNSSFDGYKYTGDECYCECDDCFDDDDCEFC